MQWKSNKVQREIRHQSVYRHLWSVSLVLLVSQVKEVQIVLNRSRQEWKSMDVRPGNPYIPQFPTTQQELKLGIRDSCVNNDQNILKTCGRRCKTECSVLELFVSLKQKFAILILTFCWPCISVYLSHYLTNLMHKICFTVSFISCLYMFRAHVLIIRRSKLHYIASGIITPIGGRGEGHL